MKEREIRSMIAELKGVTTIHIVPEVPGSDNVRHAEAHDEEGLVFIWPKGERQRVKTAATDGYMKEFKDFSLSRKDNDVSCLERDMVV